MVKRFSYIRNTLTWDVNGKLQGNGMIVVPKTGHGERGLYQCKDGYVLKVNHKHYQSKFRFKMFLKGSNTTTCLYGVWEGVTPTCAEVRKMNKLTIIYLRLGLDRYCDHRRHYYDHREYEHLDHSRFVNIRYGQHDCWYYHLKHYNVYFQFKS